jgi:hypothetical protein
MLPNIDTTMLRREASHDLEFTRRLHSQFASAWKEHSEEAGVLVQVPGGNQLVSKKAAKLKADFMGKIPTRSAERKTKIEAALRALDVRTLIREGGRFRSNPDGTATGELLNIELRREYEADFASMPEQGQVDEIKRLIDGLDFNGPTEKQAAMAHSIDRVHRRAPLTGLANSAYIELFGGIGNNNKPVEGALEVKWYPRRDMVNDLKAALKNDLTTEGYGTLIEHPERDTHEPSMSEPAWLRAVRMDRAQQHGNLKAA